MSEIDPVASRAKQIDYIKRRLEAGDMLYSAYTVQILLTEIEELSELCLALRQLWPRATSPLSASAQAFVDTCGMPNPREEKEG